MSYTHGFQWTEDKVKDLKDLKILGFKDVDVSRILSKKYSRDVSISSIVGAKARYGLLKHLLDRDPDIKIYKNLELKDDNYMISCDYHAPYFSELWVNRLLAIADKFKIRKNIIIGDLFDFDFIKHYYEPEQRDLDKEIKYSEPVIKALDYFDENILLQGNHERRIGIQTNSLIQAKHLFGVFGAEIWNKKFKYSDYDKLTIGKSWLCIHPKSYSQISVSVARRMAEKYHRNIINAHGHFVGSGFDRSGKYMAIDLGGMFDDKKVGYVNLSSTTHPAWNLGFGAILNNHFYHFNEMTDFKFWLNGRGV